VLTLGIDLATQNLATAVCRVEWTDKSAVATVLPGGPKGESKDWLGRAIRDTLDSGGWVGIDAPLDGPRRWWQR